MTPIANIFTAIPAQLPAELFQTLFQNPQLKIERIISQGQMTPENQWYDQEQAEWVILLQGHAQLQFFEETTIISLQAGDYLYIPPHKKHRVAWTEPNGNCVWLAVHFYERAS